MAAGKCLHFNGNDTRVELGTFNPGYGGALTIEMWLYVSSNGTCLAVSDLIRLNVAKDSAGSYSLSYREARYTGHKLVSKCWVHLALTFTNGTMTIILNGMGNGARHPVELSGEVEIWLGTPTPGESFGGMMMDVRVWDHARTPEAVRNAMYRRLSGYERGLRCYLPLDGQSGGSIGTAQDAARGLASWGDSIYSDWRTSPWNEMGSSKEITAGVFGDVQGAPSLGSQQDLVSRRARPARVVAGEFDGVSTFVVSPFCRSIGSTSWFTVAAWVRPASVEGPLFGHPVFSLSSGGAGWEVCAGGDWVSLVCRNGDEITEQSAMRLPGNCWHHIAMVREPKYMQTLVLVNGRVACVIRSSMATWSGYVTVGRGVSENSYFVGQIAEVTITNLGEPFNPDSIWTRSWYGSGIRCGLEGSVGDGWTAHNLRYVLSSVPLPDSSEQILASIDFQNRLEVADKEIVDARAKVLPLLGVTSTDKTLLPLLDDLATKLGTLTQDKTSLQQELASARMKLQGLLETTISDQITIQTLLDQLQGKLVELKKAKANITASRDSLLSINESQNLSILQKETQIKTLENDISKAAGKLDQAAEQIEDLKTQLADLQAKEQLIADLRDKIQTLENERAQTSLEDFVKNANNEITRARQTLADRGSKYALGRVTLEVKMLPGPSGVGMKFPTLEELKELGSVPLSTLNVDFEAQDEAEGKPTEVVVPTVLGYTEVLARRKLADAGLLVETSYQAVKEVPGRTIEADRVVNQIPKAGDQTPPGSTVTIFIGRKS